KRSIDRRFHGICLGNLLLCHEAFCSTVEGSGVACRARTHVYFFLLGKFCRDAHEAWWDGSVGVVVPTSDLVGSSTVGGAFATLRCRFGRSMGLAEPSDAVGPDCRHPVA